MLHRMQLVPRVDTLRRVASVEVNVHLHARDILHNGDALVFRHARIDGALINYHIALADDFANSGASANERREIRVVVIIHRGGNSHNVEVAVADLLNVAGADEAVIVDGILQQVVSHFESGIVAGHESVATLLVHVETDGGIFGAE